MLIELLVKTIWLLIPAYVPNNFAVLLGGGKPIDLGKKFLDGRRILGDGKTFRGFAGGVAGGVFAANFQLIVEKFFGIKLFASLSYWDFFMLTFLLAVGTMLGDAVGSFIKRRFGFERGAKFPVVDQMTFLIFALLLASFNKAFWKLYTPDVIVAALVLTPFFHVSVNYLAFKMGLKEVPW